MWLFTKHGFYSAGQIVLDQKKIEAREDAQVKNMVGGGRCSLVILGAAHDLKDNVQRLADDVEFIVVTTEQVGKLKDKR